MVKEIEHVRNAKISLGTTRGQGPKARFWWWVVPAVVSLLSDSTKKLLFVQPSFEGRWREKSWFFVTEDSSLRSNDFTKGENNSNCTEGATCKLSILRHIVGYNGILRFHNAVTSRTTHHSVRTVLYYLIICPNEPKLSNSIIKEWSPRLRRQADNSATLSFYFYYSIRLIFTISKKLCQFLQKVSYICEPTRTAITVLSMYIVMMLSVV